MRKHLLSLGCARTPFHAWGSKTNVGAASNRETLWQEEGTTPTDVAAAPPSASCARPPYLWRPPRRSDIDHAESRLEQLREEEEGQE